MTDWENLTGGQGTAIQFVPTTAASTPFAPVLTIHPIAANGGLCQGIDACREGACDSYIDEGVAYHELGHCIAFQHAFNRYEAAHYTGRTPSGAAPGNCGFYNFRSSFPTASNLFDFGPFDYLSTMMYGIPYPDIFRWDNSPMMPGGACSVAGSSIAPPSCAGAFCTPTCTACVQTQPQGFPSSGDASATIETYLNLAQPGWRKFARTVAEDLGAGARTPFNYDLATGVTIPSTSSPSISYQDQSAVGQQPSFTTAVYVTGSNGNIYTKARSGTTWSAWSSRSQPTGAGAMADPAAVSWGKQHIDLVATKGNTVFISTFQGTTWGSWQSLGQPPSVPPSAPAITSWGANRLDVFVRGNDNQLYWKKCTASCSGASGTWSAWTLVGAGGTFRGKPAAVSRTTGLVSVFINDMNGHLQIINKDASEVWGGYSVVSTTAMPNGLLKFDPSCPGCSSPAAGSRLTNNVDVYVRGVDDRIWFASSNAGSPPVFSAFAPLGGISTASPAAITRGSNNNLSSVSVTMVEERTRITNTSPDFRGGVWVKDFNTVQLNPTQVALGQNQDGRLEAITTGVNDNLYDKWQMPAPTFDVWQDTILSLIQDQGAKITIGRNANGTLEVVYIGLDSLLHHATQVIPGSAYSRTALINASSSAIGDMAIGQNTDGRLQIVSVGTDLVLRQVSQSAPNGPWNAEHLLSLPGSLGKRIVVGRNLNGLLEAVFLGSNNVLEHAVQSVAGSETWNISVLTPTDTTAQQIALAQNSDGRLEIMFIGLDGKLYDTEQTTPGGAWNAAHLDFNPSFAVKDVVMAQDQDGRLEAVMVDSNGVLQSVRQNTIGGTTWTFTVIETVTAGHLAVMRDSAGQLEVAFAGAADNNLYRLRQTSPNATSWTTVSSF